MAAGGRVPADQKILHVLPQEYIIDAQEGIRDPIGMSGGASGTKVHMSPAPTARQTSSSACSAAAWR